MTTNIGLTVGKMTNKLDLIDQAARILMPPETDESKESFSDGAYIS